MKVLNTLAAPLLALGSIASAASAWTFEDATLTVQGKGGVGSGSKDKLDASSALPAAVTLGASETLKILLTAKEGSKAARPHQAFLTLNDPTTGLEESFTFSVKESGKGKVELTQKDLPFQFITSQSPISASIVLASFGSSTPFKKQTFSLKVESDPSAPFPIPAAPERYAPKPEIHHIFRSDPKSPPQIISLFFTLAVLAALPLLLGAWALLGANISDFGKAFGTSPVAHGLFFGSVLAMEGVFFLYYLSWNLFQTLPVAGVVGVVAYVSGSRALTEVQERRFAGQR
ncbi:hypothetical protein K431DRAFT_256125 [Polychaeton citri CBS 116435]|uniref:Ribophorin II C-terminal domain-containing protein n=1 Tax=Polychaeton citri CBS 116435 TaxID=1314669 RepID=A0A9P4UK70_9PEZI|nr:hypothetical protein K431DRAFT_256125 [Polychaeton citri CBS 116435]